MRANFVRFEPFIIENFNIELMLCRLITIRLSENHCGICMPMDIYVQITSALIIICVKLNENLCI